MDIQDLIQKVEAVSQTYSKQYKIKRNPSWFLLKLQEEMGELTQSYLMMTGRARSKDKSKREIRNEFEKEIADVFCHVLLLANSNTVDIEKAVDEKWLKWNKRITAQEKKKKSKRYSIIKK